MIQECKIVIYDENSNFTMTKEELNLNDFIKIKTNEGYTYNIIIGYIILLTKYNIHIDITDVLDDNDINTEIWKSEKKYFGSFWNTQII